VRKSHPAPPEFRPRPAGVSPVAQTILTGAGLLLLFFAAHANYSNTFIRAARWKVYVHLPGMPSYLYHYFPALFVILGLPALLLTVMLLFPQFRRALTRPWRETRFAAPLLVVLFLLLLSIFPWEPGNLKPEDSGTNMVFYVVVAGTGFSLLMAGAYRHLRFLDAPMQQAYDRLMALPRWQFLGLCVGFTFVVTNLISFFVFEHLPHIQDSIAQLFQARIFASGRLYLPAPAFPDFFDYTHIINIPAQTGHPASGFAVENWPGPEGRWYSQYPFLHSFFIMLGVLVGMPWIVNPLFGSLSVGAIYFLGRELYDEKTGRLGAALAALTPFILNMSSEYMNHASALLFTTLFLLFYFRTVKHGRWHQALLAGLLLGLVANIRSLSALGIAAPFALHGLWLVVRRPGHFLPRFTLMVVAAGAVTSLALVYNWLTNGHPLLFGYVVKWGAGHEIGFGKSGWGDQHTPLRGLIHAGHDANLLNKFLFEWPLPALVPIAVLFAAGTRDRRDWLMLSLPLSLAGAYFLYWFHNVCFGPRFLYESSPALVLLTVRGGLALPRLVRSTFDTPTEERSVRRFVGRATAVLIILMLGIGLPPLLKSYSSYGWVNGKYLRNIKRNNVHNALVFCFHYGAGFTANPIGLEGDVIYARHCGILNAALTTAYPGRTCYYVSGDTLKELEDVEYPRSALKRALDEMSWVLSDSILAAYRTLMWPFRDLAPTGLDPALLEERLADFREVSRELFTGRHKLEDYTPALACWVLKDSREHLQIFSYMDDLESFVAGELKFTLLYVTSDGTAAIYDCRPVTGDETVVPSGY
jgi:hypothetical protein